jgi:hypothetical protein
MSIERLNKAASAAGFAMATPDDDVEVETKVEAAVEAIPSRALVLVSDAAPKGLSADLASISAWIKGHMPSFGWRQPA